MNKYKELASADSIRDALLEFCITQTQTSFLRLRRQVIDSHAYNPYSADMGDAERLISESKWDEAKLYLLSLFPNWIISPGAHFRLSYVYDQLNDEKASVLEGQLGIWLLNAILESGDGTHDRPFLVSRNEDEYDVLAHLQRECSLQRLTNDNDKVFDVWEGDNGECLWFDITDQYKYLKRKFASRLKDDIPL